MIIFVPMKYLLPAILLLITACKQEKIPDKMLRKEEPVSQTFNFHYLYTTQGKPKFEIFAPYVVENWEDEKRSQTKIEFPKSFKAYFYDSLQQKQTYISANYGKIYENKSKAVAKGNVILKNILENKTLETEELYWDKKTNKVFSNKTVKITTPEEILIGKGFESTTDFQYYKFKQISGSFKVKTEE